MEKDDEFEMVQGGQDEARLGFIRKVYGILSAQLALTAGAITAVKTIPGWNDAALQPGMRGLALGLIFVACMV